MRTRRGLGILFFCATTVAGGCASVSGLDALEVCGGAASCDASSGPEDGASGSDGATGGADGGRLPDGGFPDVSFDGWFPDAGFDVNFPFDASPPFDAKNDTAPPPPVDGGVPCGNVSCAVCCLPQGGTATCAATVAQCSGIAVTCDKTTDCPNQGDVCCGKGWQDFPQLNATCTPAAQCQGNANDAVLCVPNGPACPNGNSCVGQFSRDGVTFHYCF